MRTDNSLVYFANSASAIYSKETLLIRAEGFLSKIPIRNKLGMSLAPFSSRRPNLTILVMISSRAALEGVQTINLFL